jgi:hypothetical protein
MPPLDWHAWTAVGVATVSCVGERLSLPESLDPSGVQPIDSGHSKIMKNATWAFYQADEAL